MTRHYYCERGERGPAVFRIEVPQGEIDELRRRINATRWPTRELVTDRSQGVQLAGDTEPRVLLDDRVRLAPVRGAIERAAAVQDRDRRAGHSLHPGEVEAPQRAADHHHPWLARIDHRAVEDHRPAHRSDRYGGTPADAFDVVIPSLPGYGFSGKPTVNGWDPQHIARAWAVLMQRLGYTRYVAQGGDWGNAVTEQMALQRPTGLLAIHTNMPATIPAEIAPLIPNGPEPAGLNDEEKHAWDQLVDFYSNGLATRRKWRAGRRRSTRWRTRRWGSPPGSSTTTFAATTLSSASSMAQKRV